MPRVCNRVQLPDGSWVIVTTSTNINPNDPCGFCMKRTRHEKLCDFPIHRGKNTKRYTCSARLCGAHGELLGGNFDLCPPHAALVAHYQLGPRLLPLLQQATIQAHQVALDLIGAAAGVLRADWWEFFTERAAIAEYEGGATRAEAEALAWALLGQRR